MREREMPCGCLYDPATGEIVRYADYCLIAKAMDTLADACIRAAESKNGELAGIAFQGLAPLLECTAIGYSHREPYREFGDIWNFARAAAREAWEVWREEGAPHWVGEAPEKPPIP